VNTVKWLGGAKKQPGWLVIATREDQLSFVHGSFAPSGKSAITRFGTAEIEARPHALEKLARELNFDRYECATLLQPGEYQLLLVEAPTVPQAELKSAIRWRIKDMLDYHVDDATMDVLDIPPESDLAGRSHSMYAIAARNEVIQQRVRAFEEARIALSVIDIPETAQRNICALHETEGRGAALLYLGQESGLLTITCRSELYLARRIDIGLGQIMGRQAEARADLCARIVLELQRSFDHFERQFHYVTVSKLVLGPEPEETGLHDHLKANLDIPVERVDLSGHVSFNGRGAPDGATQWQLFHLIGASLRHEAKVL
jgi:MSHA biogenesis protein MshI